MTKRIIATAVVTIYMIGTLTLCSCEMITPQATDENTPTPTEALASEWTGEPCLSPEAQKIKQFSLPEEREICAEIIIEGYGSIFVKFFTDKAPKAVENFMTHSREGYYDGVSFHRIIEDFMIQGGDPEGTGYGGESIWGKSFEDEISTDLHMYRGALCMANSGENTNGSQFFIIGETPSALTEIRDLLEYQDMTFSEYIKAGYGVTVSAEQLEQYYIYGGSPWLETKHTIFGQVYDGFDVLDAVMSVSTDNKGKPYEDVIIKTVKLFEYTK